VKSQAQIIPNPKQIPMSPSAGGFKTGGKSQESVGSIGILDLFGTYWYLFGFWICGGTPGTGVKGEGA